MRNRFCVGFILPVFSFKRLFSSDLLILAPPTINFNIFNPVNEFSTCSGTPWLQNHTWFHSLSMDELGATKSMSNPKIKLRTSIIFQQCISWANNITLYHQDLIQKNHQ
jgi:hypothetical protein